MNGKEEGGEGRMITLQEIASAKNKFASSRNRKKASVIGHSVVGAGSLQAAGLA